MHTLRFRPRHPTGATAQNSSPEFLGHPRGLTFLFATEMWERFSYYGMRALLVLYMVKYLLHPDQAGAVAGYGAIKTALEVVSGPLSVQALASQIYGLYTGLVYLTPSLRGPAGGPLSGSAPDRDHRCRPDGGGPLHDGL